MIAASLNNVLALPAVIAAERVVIDSPYDVGIATRPSAFRCPTVTSNVIVQAGEEGWHKLCSYRFRESRTEQG